MNFESIYYEDVKVFTDILFTAGPITLLIAFVFLMVAIASEGKRHTNSIIIAWVLIVLVIISMAVFVFWNPEKINREAFENNLKQKYDIEAIIEDDPMYKVRPQTSREQLILVENKDGQQGAFFLTQDMDTFEPTLKELTNNDGGSSLTLEDIQK